MCGFGMWLVNPPVAQGREWNAPSKCSWGHRAWRWGREECHSTQNSRELQTWREVRLRNVCVGPGVFRIGTHLIDSLLVQTGRVRQAKCRLHGTRGGRVLGSAIPTANSGPWASQIPENLCFSAKLVPSESLAALPHWEPVQSHTGEDTTAFTGTEPPQICVFCWFSLCFAL